MFRFLRYDVRLEKVLVTLARRTGYPGEMFDNRPTSVVAPLEKHGTPGVSIRHADRVLRLRLVSVRPQSA